MTSQAAPGAWLTGPLPARTGVRGVPTTSPPPAVCGGSDEPPTNAVTCQVQWLLVALSGRAVVRHVTQRKGQTRDVAGKEGPPSPVRVSRTLRSDRAAHCTRRINSREAGLIDEVRSVTTAANRAPMEDVTSAPRCLSDAPSGALWWRHLMQRPLGTPGPLCVPQERGISHCSPPSPHVPARPRPELRTRR